MVIRQKEYREASPGAAAAAEGGQLDTEPERLSELWVKVPRGEQNWVQAGSKLGPSWVQSWAKPAKPGSKAGQKLGPKPGKNWVQSRAKTGPKLSADAGSKPSGDLRAPRQEEQIGSRREALKKHFAGSMEAWSGVRR